MSLERAALENLVVRAAEEVGQWWVGRDDDNVNMLVLERFAHLVMAECKAKLADRSVVGGLEYEGNTVSYIYDKKRAYALAISNAWVALSDAGFPSDGKTELCDAIRYAIVETEKKWSDRREDEE